MCGGALTCERVFVLVGRGVGPDWRGVESSLENFWMEQSLLFLQPQLRTHCM